MPTLRRAALLASLLGSFAGLALPAPGTAAPPPEDRCPLAGGAFGASPDEDAVPVVLREGMVATFEDVLRLRELLPPEIWRLRDVFFHDGMRMEIGPCHRRYPVPGFFAEATARFAGSARLDEAGNLLDHVAGLPFPPDSLDPEAKDAGARWAWNTERRFRGAGPVGHFRIVEMQDQSPGTFTYRGDWFFLQTSQRADLEETGFALPEAPDTAWIAGGRFDEPFAARHLAWRQLRPLSTQREYTKTDDTFVYLPSMRKTRRSATAWIDGLYAPHYRASAGDDGGGGIAIGADPYAGSQGAIQPTAGRSTAVSETLRAGFTGLALRPNAYAWRLAAEREVLAPLNVSREGYPLADDRNFGASGLSLGSDRWDLRHAAVIQGLARDAGGAFQRIELWVDWQTQQPLYLITRTRQGALVDVQIFAHRFSGDVLGYPLWPDGSKTLVFDPVAAVSWSPLAGGSGWRRESYDLRSVPGDPDQVRRQTSTNALMRGK